MTRVQFCWSSAEDCLWATGQPCILSDSYLSVKGNSDFLASQKWRKEK